MELMSDGKGEMHFRLLRSRALWLGVPGLVFLLWAWGDSMRHATSIRCLWKVGFQVTQISGTATFAVWRDSLAVGFPDFEGDRREMPDEHAVARAKLFAEVDLAWMRADESPRSISVRHPVVLAGYLFPWSALIAWRWWRCKRASLEMLAG